MPWYRSDDGQSTMHVLIRGRGAPGVCVSPPLEGDNLQLGLRCSRMASQVCDGPAGHTLGGKVLTCDAPMCKHHCTHVGPDQDLCPRCIARGVKI